MERLKGLRPLRRQQRKTHLHSSMERLKAKKKLKGRREDLNLHSSMERLKVLMHQKGVTAYRDLHSSMERLKDFILPFFFIHALTFTFQYGEIKRLQPSARGE